MLKSLTFTVCSFLAITGVAMAQSQEAVPQVPAENHAQDHAQDSNAQHAATAVPDTGHQTQVAGNKKSVKKAASGKKMHKRSAHKGANEATKALNLAPKAAAPMVVVPAHVVQG